MLMSLLCLVTVLCNVMYCHVLLQLCHVLSLPVSCICYCPAVCLVMYSFMIVNCYLYDAIILLFVWRYPYVVCSFLSDLLYFTQINKVLARSLGVCLGEDVVVLAGSMHASPTIFLNYNTWLPWRPHKLLLSNCGPPPGPCKWPPPQSPFASALVTDWYQYSGCPSRMYMAPLYKRAGLPCPVLTFWLNVT